MKKFFATLFAVAMCLAINAAHAVPTANYNPTTGNITFVDVAPAVVGLRMNELTELPGLVAGQATKLDGAAGCATFCVVNDQANLGPLGFIEWGNLLGMTFASSSAGNIFPTGLNQGGVDAAFRFLYRNQTAPTVDVIGQIVVVGGVQNQAPVLQDDGPIGTGLNRTFMHQFTVLQDDMLPTPGLTWSIQSFTGGPAPNPPTIDGNGKLSWNTTGAQGGGTLYTAVVRATDNGQLFDETSLVIKVPEPGTMVLAGLSLIGIVTSRRRLT